MWKPKPIKRLCKIQFLFKQLVLRLTFKQKHGIGSHSVFSPKKSQSLSHQPLESAPGTETLFNSILMLPHIMQTI